MASNNENKIRIKPIGGKNSDAIWVYPVDAKEIVAQGTHEIVGKSELGKADWLPEVESSKSVSTAKTDEDSDELTEEKINSMNTKELEELVKTQELVIDGFSKMNLKNKREAVISALQETGDETDEDSDKNNDEDSDEGDGDL